VIFMAYVASHRFARIAPRKARLVADQIRGHAIDRALATLELSKRRGGWVRVDEGPTIKRFQPKDRGRAHPIRKRTSHIHVAVEERD
jgi:large subunit ribosomal protein L22